MDTQTTFAGMPLWLHLVILYATLAIKWGAELYSIVVKGGGLKHIAATFIYGENAPKIVLDDLAQRQSTPPIPPATPAPKP